MEDWQEQLRNSIVRVDQLEQYINLTDEERKGIEQIEGVFNWV